MERADNILTELTERGARGDWDAEAGAAWAAEFHLDDSQHSDHSQMLCSESRNNLSLLSTVVIIQSFQ